MLQIIIILGCALAWIGCERGVEVTPPAVTSEAGVAEASAIPNITSSIFQNQSFECLNEVYTTSQNVKASLVFDKEFSHCRFLAVIAEEFLGGSPTNRGHVFSREALENPASDTFGEYRNEVINPNTSANSDLSTSQRAREQLSGRCSAAEEIKVKRIEPTPGALRIVPPGCKDASGNQPEYAFSLVFCCPKPALSPTPTPSDTGVGGGLVQDQKCDPVALLRQADVSQLSGLNLRGDRSLSGSFFGSDPVLSAILTNFANDGKASLVKTKIFFKNSSFVEIDLEVQGLELFSVEINLKTGQETATRHPLSKQDVIDTLVELIFINLIEEADAKNIPTADRNADTAKEVLAALIKSLSEQFPFKDPQSLTGHVCNKILAAPSLHHTSFTKSFFTRDAAGNPDIKKTVQLNLLLSGFVRSCCPISPLDQGVCNVITTSTKMTANGLTSGRNFIPQNEIGVFASQRLSGENLFTTLPDAIKTRISQSEIPFFLQKRFGASDLNTIPLQSGFRVQFNEMRAPSPEDDLLTILARAMVFFPPAEFSEKGAIASGEARTSHLPLEKEIYLLSIMGKRGIEGIGIAERNSFSLTERIFTITVLFFENRPSTLILADTTNVSGGLFGSTVAFDCGGIDQ